MVDASKCCTYVTPYFCGFLPSLFPGCLLKKPFTLVIITLHLFRKFDELTAELHPIPVRDEVWHTVGVDLIDPQPEEKCT